MQRQAGSNNLAQGAMFPPDVFGEKRDEMCKDNALFQGLSRLLGSTPQCDPLVKLGSFLCIGIL